MRKFLNSLFIGFKRRWLAGLTRAFGIAGIIWLVTEIGMKALPHFNRWLDEQGYAFLAFVILVSAARFLAHIYETRSVSFIVPTTDSRIEIKFGDLFAEQTDWLIGVGEFFDSDVGHVVSSHSLHGKVIEKVWNSNTGKFRIEVDRALTGMKSLSTKRTFEPKRKYAIGTTAVLPNGNRKIFLVAMANVDLDTAKATTDVPLLWTALRGALASIRHYGNGATVSLPLIGNGRSNVNIEPQHLLRLIILALVDYGRKVALPKQVNVIVPEDCFESLDIREIKRDWQAR